MNKTFTNEYFMHSTKQCNYPNIYKIQLSLYSAIITIFKRDNLVYY